MITKPNLPDEGTSALLEEYFQSGYSIKDFCFLKETVDEATLYTTIEKYAPEKLPPDDDPFIDLTVNVIGDPQPVRPKKQRITSVPALFAIIGDEIQLYREMPAEYLKSLKS